MIARGGQWAERPHNPPMNEGEPAGELLRVPEPARRRLRR
jgi:hypothetical protein